MSLFQGRRLYILLVVVSIIFIGCKADIDLMKPEQLNPPQSGDEIAIIETTAGTIKLRLLTDSAPETVEAFKRFVDDHYYEGGQLLRSFQAEALLSFVSATDEDIEYWKTVIGEDYILEIDTEYRHYPGAIGFSKHYFKYPSAHFYIVAEAEVDHNYLDSLRLLPEQYSSESITHYGQYGGDPRFDNVYTVFAHVYEGMDTVMKIFNTPYNPYLKESDEEFEILTIHYRVFD